MFWIISSETMQKVQQQAKVVAREVRKSEAHTNLTHFTTLLHFFLNDGVFSVS